jgi:transposase InsO family protein
LLRWKKPRPTRRAHGEFESEHPGYCGAQDTFYVGNLKGVGRIYQQTVIDTYTKVAFAKLYDCRRRSQQPTSSMIACLRSSTARESSCCACLPTGAANPAATRRGASMSSTPAIEDIDHSRPKTKSPQTNEICERFHKTVLNEFYRIAFRKKVYH